MILRVALLLAVLAGISFTLAPGTAPDANAWGFYGHKRINRMACYTLPPEMFPFFKRHIDFISDHAVDPDRRRYAVPGEAERHYIDIDHYAKGGEDPFPSCRASGMMQWPSSERTHCEHTASCHGTSRSCMAS
ncbi:MAG: hypothetical protein IPM46_09995 [Flavobacteriales bacterium]|nr:hypothetical protein [Flavobacteriales bacterium]